MLGGVLVYFGVVYSVKCIVLSWCVVSFGLFGCDSCIVRLVLCVYRLVVCILFIRLICSVGYVCCV